MTLEVPVYSIALPEYTVDSEPDHKKIGRAVDDLLRTHFCGETVVARGLSSGDHPGLSRDELVERIRRLGTDRYDPTRPGDRYDNLQGKHIDLFAFRRKLTPRTELFQHICWGFYHSAIAIHGKPVRIDILTVYDASKLRAVVHQYEGRTDLKRDGYAFRDPGDKPAALKAVVKITDG